MSFLPPLNVNPDAEVVYPKNPSSIYQTNPEAQATYGLEDERRPANVGEGYDSVMRIEAFDKSGRSLGQCTATYSVIDGYENEGSLGVTAAHCIPEDAVSIVARGDFVNADGQYDRFTMYSNEFEVHPDFRANNPDSPNTISDPSSDVAIIQFDQIPPADVIPANYISGDLYEMNEMVIEAGTPNGIIGTPIISGGFSADMVGMGVDEGCYIRGIQGPNEFLTDCDGAQGSSGGPNFLRDNEGAQILDDEGRPIAIGVNSHSGTDGFSSGKASLSSDFLDASRLVERKQTPALENGDAQGVVAETSYQEIPASFVEETSAAVNPEDYSFSSTDIPEGTLGSTVDLDQTRVMTVPFGTAVEGQFFMPPELAQTYTAAPVPVAPMSP